MGPRFPDRGPGLAPYHKPASWLQVTANRNHMESRCCVMLWYLLRSLLLGNSSQDFHESKPFMSCQGKIQRWQVKKILTRSTEHLGCRGTHCWVSLCFYVSYLWKAPGSLVFEMCCHAWDFGHFSKLIIDNEMEEPWKLSNSGPTLGPKSQSIQSLPYRAAAITLFALARRGRRGTNLTGCGMVRPLPPFDNF